MPRALTDAERLHHAATLRQRTGEVLLRAQADVARIRRAFAETLAGQDLDRMGFYARETLDATMRQLAFEAVMAGRALAPHAVAGLLERGLQAWSLIVPLAARAGRDLWLPTGHEAQLPWLWALAELTGDEPAAAWLGQLQHAFFRSGVIDSVPGDPQFNELLWWLAKTRHTGEWPDAQDLPDALGRYRPLMERQPGSGDTVGHAMETLGDIALRCRAAWHPVQADLIYETDPWGLLPLDLQLLSHRRAVMLGTPLPWPRSHPWLAVLPVTSPVGPLPAVAEADPLAAQLEAVATHALGERWMRCPPLPALPD